MKILKICILRKEYFLVMFYLKKGPKVSRNRVGIIPYYYVYLTFQASICSHYQYRAKTSKKNHVCCSDLKSDYKKSLLNFFNELNKMCLDSLEPKIKVFK